MGTRHNPGIRTSILNGKCAAMVCFRFIRNLPVLALLAIALGGRAIQPPQPETHGLDDQGGPSLAARVVCRRNGYVGRLTKPGFVDGSGTPAARTAGRFTNTAYHTDGLRVVSFSTIRPLALPDIQLLGWAP